MASALDQMHYESMISSLPLLRSQLENNLLRQKSNFTFPSFRCFRKQRLVDEKVPQERSFVLSILQKRKCGFKSHLVNNVQSKNT